MPDQIGPTTPESLVEAVYAKFPERVADRLASASAGR